jgi:hypothetical protein
MKKIKEKKKKPQDLIEASSFDHASSKCVGFFMET